MRSSFLNFLPGSFKKSALTRIIHPHSIPLPFPAPPLPSLLHPIRALSSQFNRKEVERCPKDGVSANLSWTLSNIFLKQSFTKLNLQSNVRREINIIIPAIRLFFHSLDVSVVPLFVLSLGYLIYIDKRSEILFHLQIKFEIYVDTEIS